MIRNHRVMPRCLGAVVLSCLLPVSLHAACVAADPAGTARWVFEHADEFYVHKKGSPRYLSPALYALLQRDWKCQEPGEICAIGAYPWTNAQDGSVLEPITWRVASQDATTASVAMSFVFGWEEQPQDNKPTTITLSLVHPDAKGCWLLDDIVHGTDSFKKRLADFDYATP
jgi:hypothetical protein